MRSYNYYPSNSENSLYVSVAVAPSFEWRLINLVNPQPDQRIQTETIIEILRQHPGGLARAYDHCTTVYAMINDWTAIVADFTGGLTTIPTHRINDVLTALVRAKVAIKKTVPVCSVAKSTLSIDRLH